MLVSYYRKEKASAHTMVTEAFGVAVAGFYRLYSVNKQGHRRHSEDRD